MTAPAAHRCRWTEAELAFIRQRYPHESTHAVARALGRTAWAVYSQARFMAVRKTPTARSRAAQDLWARRRAQA